MKKSRHRDLSGGRTLRREMSLFRYGWTRYAKTTTTREMEGAVLDPMVMDMIRISGCLKHRTGQTVIRSDLI